MGYNPWGHKRGGHNIATRQQLIHVTTDMCVCVCVCVCVRARMRVH